MPNSPLEWISSQVDELKDVIRTTFPSRAKVSDPENIDSQVDPGDLDTPEEITREEELRYCRLGDERFKRSEEKKLSIEQFVLEGAGNYYGYQWHEYNAGLHKLRPMHRDAKDRYYWQTFNLVEGFVNKRQSHVLAQYPDLWPAPLTTRAEDMKSAQACRSVLAHCNRRNDYQKLLKDWVFGALITSTTFDWLSWDASAEVDVAVPKVDAAAMMAQLAQGQLPPGAPPGEPPMAGGAQSALPPTGPPSPGAPGVAQQSAVMVDVEYKKAKLGDVSEKIRLCGDIFIDPGAKEIDEAEWIGDEEKMSLDLIKRLWPKNGPRVRATEIDSEEGSFERRIERVADGSIDSATGKKTCAKVRRILERPSWRYPRVGMPGDANYKRGGRYWVYAGDVLLECREWPYDKCDGYPCIGIGWKRILGSVWSDNMVTILRDAQREFNQAWTKILGRMNTDKLYIMIPETSNIKPGLYDNPRDYSVFTYKQAGGLPVFQQPTQLGPFYFSVTSGLYQVMCNMTGIHDLFDNDNLPPNFTAKMMEQFYTQDRTVDSMWVDKEICPALVKRAEWQLAFYRQFGTQQERLMGLDDRAIPASPIAQKQFVAMERVNLEALKNGECRVICTPGSGLAKSPAAQDEDVMETFKEGGFGEPGSPPSVKALLTLKQSIRSDENVDNIIKSVEEYAASQPNPAQVQQAKIASDAAAQQAQLQHAQEMAAIDVDAEQKKQDARVQAEIAIEQARHENEMKQITAKASIPSVALTGKLDMEALPAAEQIAVGASQSPEELQSAADAEQKAKAKTPAAKGSSDGSK